MTFNGHQVRFDLLSALCPLLSATGHCLCLCSLLCALCLSALCLSALCLSAPCLSALCLSTLCLSALCFSALCFSALCLSAPCSLLPAVALVDFEWLCLVGFTKAYGVSADDLDTKGDKYKVYNVMHGLHNDGYVGEHIDITYLGEEYERGEPNSLSLSVPLSFCLSASVSLSVCFSLSVPLSVSPSLSFSIRASLSLSQSLLFHTYC